MDKAPKFKYVPEASSDVGANCPIQIMEGQYKNIIYRYGKNFIKRNRKRRDQCHHGN
jgi:hypothetical protein